MTTINDCEYLSFGDSLFLYLEREGTPLNIASLAIFDGEIPVKELRDLVASKLNQTPRYMQRVVVPPLNVGAPYWEFAANFRLERHIREIQLKHGTSAELKTVASQVLSRIMDRQNPLWDFTLVHGLKEDRTAMIARAHHCMADGISGMRLMHVLMDPSPAKPPVTRGKIRVPRRKVGKGPDIVNSAMQSWFSSLERLLHAGGDVLTLFQRATGISDNSSAGSEMAIADRPGEEQIIRAAAELAELPERLPFNVLCHGPQRYEWTEAPSEELKALRNGCGATLNDVILTILTATFRDYSELHGLRPRGRSIRIVVPVSTRRHHSDELGNHISFAPFSAPLGIRNPKKLLTAIHQRMEFVKHARVIDLVSFAGTLLGTLPTPLQAILAPIISELPITVCNTICTNVPGPKRPLYLLGHEMLSAYPYVPIGGEMGINCAVLSYNGTVYFGFTGDVVAAPDLEKLPKIVDHNIVGLLRAAGIHRSRRGTAKDSHAPDNGKVIVRETANAPVPDPKAAQPESVRVASTAA